MNGENMLGELSTGLLADLMVIVSRILKAGGVLQRRSKRREKFYQEGCRNELCEM